MSGSVWRQIMLGEDAAVYAYGVLAAQLAGTDRNRAVELAAAHSRQRDRARAKLEPGDSTDAPGAYEIPFPLTDASAAKRLAATVEDRLAGVYASAVAGVDPEQRLALVESAREAAVRAVRWGAAPQAVPGSTNPAMGELGSDSSGTSGRPATGGTATGGGATGGGGATVRTPTPTGSGVDGAVLQP